MLKRTVAIMLVELILLTAFGSKPASAQSGGRLESGEQAKATVSKIGVGQKARVEVKLRDNTRLKGYISEAREDSFVVTDSRTGAAMTVAYADVSNVKRQGGGPSTLTLAIIGAAAVAAIIVGVTVVKPVLCDGGAGC